MKTRLIWLCFLAASSLLVASVIDTWPDENVHIVVCDVGQGDAILLTEGFVQVLIDAGATDSVLTCLKNHLPFWDKTLELVVLTHADKDHYGGMVPVLSRYSVGHLIDTPQTKEGEDFAAFRELVSRKQKQGMRVSQPEVGEVLELGKRIKLTTIWTQAELEQQFTHNSYNAEAQLWDVKPTIITATTDTNAGSTAFLAEFLSVSLLLTGDLGAEGEQALAAGGLIPDVDLLKVGHHGSKTSSSPAFIARAQPEISLISCGKNNRYGHPHPDVVEVLTNARSKIVRTDQEGTIEVVTDGQRYWFASSR